MRSVMADKEVLSFFNNTLAYTRRDRTTPLNSPKGPFQIVIKIPQKVIFLFQICNKLLEAA